MTEYDLTRLTDDELINGILVTNLDDYIRTKANGEDVRETIAQITATLIQIAFNQGLDVEQANAWAMQLANKVDKGTLTFADINLNLGKLDATYFTDEFLNALSGGTINATNVLDGTITKPKIANSAVSPEKTDFVETIQENVLSGYTISNGYYSADGVTRIGSTAYRSPIELIPVLPNSTYQHNFYNINIYDENKAIIAVVGSANVNGKGTYTTDSNTYYISPMIENATVPIGNEYLYDLTNSDIVIPRLSLINSQNKEIEIVEMNILEDYNFVTGYYITTGLNPDANYYTTSELIPVVPNEIYEHNFYNMNLHDANGTMLRAAGSSVVNGSGSYTIPSDTYYIRPTIKLANTPKASAYFYLASKTYFKVDGLLITSENLAQSSETTKFVSTTGSDENSGSKLAPFKTIGKALESGAETINIERGKYIEQFIANTDKLILNAYGDSEDDVIVSGADTFDNTKWTAYNAIFKQAYAQSNKYFNQVFISKTQQPIITGARSDTYGATIWEGNNGVDDYKMKPVLTLAECEAEVGTFYYDGTDVYINPQNINSEFNAVRLDGNSIVANELKMNDIKFDFYNNETVKLDNVKNLEVNNAEFNHSVRADGVSIDRTNGTFNNSKAFKNRNDGFNLHYKGATVFNNCYGVNNYDDGISHHESCEGIINGGVWSGNGKGGISPAYGAKVNWYNCILENNAYGIFGESYAGVENISSGNLYKGNTVDIRATNGKIASFNDQFLDGAPKLEGTQSITIY